MKEDSTVHSGQDGSAAGQPLVSVLMAAYNPGRYLAEAICSVLAQTFTRFELVVLDDGSTDGTWELLQDFAVRDSRVRPFRNDRNLGFSGTRNRLFTLMNPASEYIAVLDSDDVALRDRLENQLGFLEAHPELGAVGSSIIIIGEDSRITGFRSYPETASAVRTSALCANPLAHSTLFMRKSVHEQLGGYGTELSCCEDYDYLLRMLAITDIANLPVPQVAYRISASQWTKRRIRHSLLVSQKVQRRHFFRKDLFSLRALAGHALRYALALLPQHWVLQLFLHMTYRPCPQDYARRYAPCTEEGTR